jgi:hypothetical protein
MVGVWPTSRFYGPLRRRKARLFKPKPVGSRPKARELVQPGCIRRGDDPGPIIGGRRDRDVGYHRI